VGLCCAVAERVGREVAGPPSPRRLRARPMTAAPSALPLRDADRVPALDGVRGIAIVLVLLMHGMFFGMPIKGGPNPLGTTYMQYATLGWCGVDVFFVLSGFL